MIAAAENVATLEIGAPVDQYLVSHGKSGGLGSFTVLEPLSLRRGDRVVIDSTRGRQVGTVLCPANLRQARILGAVSSGVIVRPLAGADESILSQLRETGNRLFEAGCRLARAQALPVEILDVEVLFDGHAILQFLGAGDIPLDAFVQTLCSTFQLDIRLENLALPQEPAEPEVQGCGKPDCGKKEGGCSTCSTGGGCSSCGTGQADLRPYFAHLRTQMEANHRTPLL